MMAIETKLQVFSEYVRGIWLGAKSSVLRPSTALYSGDEGEFEIRVSRR